MDCLFWAIIGYLAGSLPTGYLLVKAKTGNDIRTLGSGNIGATNVGRVLGKKWAVLVTAIDMLKGGIVVCVVNSLAFPAPAAAVAAFAAVCGHNYPFWLSFHGGKGVATTLGTLFFVALPHSAVCVLAGGVIWYTVMKVTRYVSIASLVALFSIAVMFHLSSLPLPFTLLACALALLSVWRHRGNLGRVFRGTENKVGKQR